MPFASNTIPTAPMWSSMPLLQTASVEWGPQHRYGDPMKDESFQESRHPSGSPWKSIRSTRMKGDPQDYLAGPILGTFHLGRTRSFTEETTWRIPRGSCLILMAQKRMFPTRVANLGKVTVFFWCDTVNEPATARSPVRLFFCSWTHLPGSDCRNMFVRQIRMEITKKQLLFTSSCSLDFRH